MNGQRDKRTDEQIERTDASDMYCLDSLAARSHVNNFDLAWSELLCLPIRSSQFHYLSRRPPLPANWNREREHHRPRETGNGHLRLTPTIVRQMRRGGGRMRANYCRSKPISRCAGALKIDAAPLIRARVDRALALNAPSWLPLQVWPAVAAWTGEGEARNYYYVRRSACECICARKFSNARA